MRIILILIATALAAAFLLAACVGDDDAGAAARTEVVAAFYPLAFAARELGDDRVAVTDLTPVGAEPHDLELSVRDAARIRSADLVLLVGGGFQPAVEEAAAQADGEVVDVLADAAPTIEDPHVWLDPELYADVVGRIAAALGAEDAAEPLTARLAELDAAFARGLADCARREIVVSHAAFGHLAAAYDLEQIPIAGLAPEAEASAADLERIARLVAEQGVTTVFVEPLASPDEAETIARETGAETAVLNPIEGLTEEEADRSEDYFSLMRANLAALREALACH